MPPTKKKRRTRYWVAILTTWAPLFVKMALAAHDHASTWIVIHC